MRLADDQRVVREAGIGGGVGYDQNVVGSDRARAERVLTRGSVHGQAAACLEPLARIVDQRDKRDRAAERAARDLDHGIEFGFGRGVEQRERAQHRQAVALGIVIDRGEHSGHGTAMSRQILKYRQRSPGE